MLMVIYNDTRRPPPLVLVNALFCALLYCRTANHLVLAIKERTSLGPGSVLTSICGNQASNSA